MRSDVGICCMPGTLGQTARLRHRSFPRRVAARRRLRDRLTAFPQPVGVLADGNLVASMVR
jgi:hypothetical protein